MRAIVDCSNVPKETCRDMGPMREAIRRAVNSSGVEIVLDAGRDFAPTGFVLYFKLNHSHVSVHSYVAGRDLYLDIDSGPINPNVILDSLQRELDLGETIVRMIRHGDGSEAAV